MNKILALAATVATLAACAPVGSGDGELTIHTGWRGIISAGPASEDGAIACGRPPSYAFDCEDGASVRVGRGWIGCARPGQPDIGGNGSLAAGDFVLLGHSGEVIGIGATRGDTMSRVWCVRDSEPVSRGWLGTTYQIRPGFPKVEDVCWDPDTGAAADCAEMGR